MNSKSRSWIKHAVLLIVALAGLSFSLAAAAEDGKIEVLWLGQAAMRIKTVSGKVIVIDPWLINNPRTPQQYKDLDALGKVDLILVTHGHGDHFADAPALAIKNKAPAYMPAGLQASVIALGILPAELAPRMNKSGTVMPLGPGIKITMVRAEHSSELAWKNPATGKEEQHVGGEPAGYIIELENGFKIYHMGDTGLFGDMKLIAEYYKPDLIMIPVGGNFVMNPQDAAFATREWLKPKFAIPIHYGTNPLMKGTAEEFVQAMGTSPTKIFPMKPGDKIEF
jgi:L-ascorbate metabolism protein UlaG (beta-lactamase superfamily)